MTRYSRSAASEMQERYAIHVPVPAAPARADVDTTPRAVRGLVLGLALALFAWGLLAALVWFLVLLLR